MSESVNVQYVGFEAKALVREYSFLVRQGSSGTREFTLAIVNEAFSSHRVRYQDGPDICSLKLHRELATERHIADGDPTADRAALRFQQQSTNVDCGWWIRQLGRLATSLIMERLKVIW